MSVPAGGKALLLTVAVLFVAVVIMTAQIVSLGNDIERLNGQVKQLMKGADTVKAQSRAQQQAEGKLREEQDADKEELEETLDQLSQQLHVVQQELGVLGSNVAGMRSEGQDEDLAAEASPTAENLISLLAPFEKALLRDAIREELDEASEKQTQILMELIAKRALAKLAGALKLTDAQKEQVNAIVRENVQNVIGVWNAGTLKDAKEFQAAIDLIMTDMNARIRGTLTTAQGAKYDKMVKQGLWGMESQKKQPQPKPKGQKAPGQ